MAFPDEPPATGDRYTDEERSHWAFQRRRSARPPRLDASKYRERARAPVDPFILKELASEHLELSPAANRATLARRLSFYLLGLPPSPRAVQQLVDNSAPDAVDAFVDRLLASPHYGQRWGQHWLDTVRFAESEGFEYDRHIENAWMYRDYVIHAFNIDKPYDRFVAEQIAGDELATAPVEPTPISQLLDNPATESRIAAGFHRLGPVRRNAGNAEVSFSRNEVLTERTDIIGSAFMGLTVGCARCHNHMFDPIRQSDYYRLQGFLAATYTEDMPLTDEKTADAWKAQTESIKERIEQLKKQLANANDDREVQLKQQIADLQQQLPPPIPALFTVSNRDSERTPIHLLARGDETKRGRKLGPRVPGVFLEDGAAEMAPDIAKPRTQLAKWLTDPRHPLTSRVIVNRVWAAHFGRGIVETPNDFGVNGATPDNADLLDFLANELIRRGWSIKSLQRLILSSNVWRQSSATAAGDADNRLLTRFPRRRLDAEELRDAMLSVSGRLNPRMRGPSVMVPVGSDLIELLYKPDQWQVTNSPDEHDRRSVYLIAKRNLRLPFLEVFDQPDLQTSCAGRERSTHAPQALELLNGELANDLSSSFAERLIRECGDDRDKTIDRAFLLATGRRSSATQRALAREFLAMQPISEFALAMFNLNAFLYVE